MKMRFAGFLVALVGAAFASLPAQALPVSTAAVGGGQGCTTSACGGTATLTWTSSSGAGSGTLSLNTGLLTVVFSVLLPSSTFVPISGPADNGVTQLDFTNTTYAGTGSLFSLGGGAYAIIGGSGSVSGTQTPTGAGSAGPFSASNSLLSGSCTDIAGTVYCGITFSALNDFNFSVNGSTRYFTHTLNITAVPEPGTALLVAAGLAALGLTGTRRRSSR